MATLPNLPSNVRPGDIISSDFINLILSELATIDQRLSALEAGGTAQTGAVTITGFDPPNQQNAGQILTINGTNFAFPPTNNLVTLDDVTVTAFRPDSTGSMLKFVIPTTLTLPSTGRNVKLSISNSNGSTTALYRIMPAIAVVGNPPKITNVVALQGGSTILTIGKQALITGQNFAATAADDIITFSLNTAAGTVTYPKAGQSLQVDTNQTNANQIVVTVPDMAEITVDMGTTPVTLQVGVGAQVPDARVVLVTR